MPSTSSCPSGLFAGASLLALLAAPPAFAAPAEPVLSFAIPAGSLESALTAYATNLSADQKDAILASLGQGPYDTLFP
mgnify:CR=1 FL=1